MNDLISRHEAIDASMLVMKTNLDWAGYFMTMSHRMAKCTSEEQMSC